MDRARFAVLPSLRTLRRFAFGFCAAGWPLVAAGCAREREVLMDVGDPPPRHAVVAPAGADKGVVRADYRPDDVLPPAGAPAAPAAVPVDLDAVFRLAEGQNSQIALAREKVDESLIENAIAAKGWLPNVTAGIGYYRHEGGIQNEDGTLTRSSTGALFPGVELRTELDLRQATFARIQTERNRLQQQGELAKVSHETLLEAADAYIDLLTARRGEAVAHELEELKRDLLKRAEAGVKEGGAFLLEGVQTEMTGEAVAAAKLHHQGDAAAAKLAYLLGLDPCADLVPVDETLTPIDLVDATPPTCDLVARALRDGPGVKELEGLLNLIQSGLAEMDSPLRFLPTLCLCVNEGAFGAGPDDNLTWANRLDVGLQARWNLTEWVTARDKKRLAYSKERQVELSLKDLRGKLTAGVKEAREAILSGREQLRQGRETVEHAGKAYDLSKKRLEQGAAGASVAEVLQAVRGLELAHLNYISAVNAYNKAQVRLLLLLGPGPGADGACPAR
jgi:outer membrane protein TolC